MRHLLVWIADHPRTMAWLLFVTTLNLVINVMQILGVL